MSDDRSQIGRVRRRTGLFVLVASILFLAAVLQAGVLRDMFRSTATLRILLPEDGLSGLAAGAPVEVLGTQAGVVKRIVIEPTQTFHALVELNADMTPFVRRDSTVAIRKQFGIVGAAFLEIGRGRGDPLDWDYAVLSATTGGSPTDSIGQIAQQVQESVLPAIGEARRAASAAANMIESMNAQDSAFQRALSDFAAVAAGLRQGDGTVGRLLTEDKLALELEATAASARRQIDAVQVARLSSELEKTIAGLNGLLGEVRRTVPDVATVAKNSATASVALPATLMQVDRTLVELDLLLRQLRRSWLLGGGSEARQPDELPRLSPIEARP